MSALAEQHERWKQAHHRLWHGGVSAPPMPAQIIVESPAAQVERILSEVMAKHRLGIKSLLEKTMQHNITLARHEAFYRIRHEVAIDGKPISYPAIGARFGMDHATVFYGVRSYAKRMGLQ